MKSAEFEKGLFTGAAAMFAFICLMLHMGEKVKPAPCTMTTTEITCKLPVKK